MSPLSPRSNRESKAKKGKKKKSNFVDMNKKYVKGRPKNPLFTSVNTLANLNQIEASSSRQRMPMKARKSSQMQRSLLSNRCNSQRLPEMGMALVNRRAFVPLHKQAAKSILKNLDKNPARDRSSTLDIKDDQAESRQHPNTLSAKKKHPDIKPPAQIFPAQNILSQAKLSLAGEPITGPRPHKAQRIKTRSIEPLSIERNNEELTPAMNGTSAKELSTITIR